MAATTEALRQIEANFVAGLRDKRKQGLFNAITAAHEFAWRALQALKVTPTTSTDAYRIIHAGRAAFEMAGQGQSARHLKILIEMTNYQNICDVLALAADRHYQHQMGAAA